MTEKNNKDNNAQKQYLMAKIDELTDSVAPGYGEAFLDELMLRLQNTVSVFNDELFNLIEQLKENSLKRNETMKGLLVLNDKNNSPKNKIFDDPLSNAKTEMSQWEKKLEDKKNDNSKDKKDNGKEPKKKKRSFFNRKK